MGTQRRATIEDLRVAIHSLPRTTRIAMLQGIAANDIIAGAYTSGEGICPMLAAHRNGGRTNLISFAKAWDRYAFSGSRVAKPRPATARELLVLRSHLEASLLEEDAPQADLAAAIDSHRELVGRSREEAPPPGAPHAHRRRSRVRPGDRDRSRELRSKPGWRWMRVVRRYDDYQWALGQIDAERAAQAQIEAEREAQELEAERHAEERVPSFS